MEYVLFYHVLSGYVYLFTTDPADSVMSLEGRYYVDSMEAFLKTIALKDLSSLKVERLIYAEPDTQDNEKYQEGMKRLWEIWGCDRTEDYYIIYNLQDEIYVGSAQFIQYDGLWYLHELHSTMSGFVTPDAMKLSGQQYEILLEELGEKK